MGNIKGENQPSNRIGNTEHNIELGAKDVHQVLDPTNLAEVIGRPNFRLMVTMGLVPGMSWIDKFGENPEVGTGTDPEDLWEFGGLYNFTVDTGVPYYFSSDSTADVNKTISFQVLTVDANDNWNLEEFTQIINGQTKTQLNPPSGDPIVRIFRMENESDADQDITGTFYVYEDDTVTNGTPDTNDKVRAIIDNGENQTLMAIYTIPTGYVGFLFEGELGMSKSGGVSAEARMSYRSRRYGKVMKVKKKIAVQTTGTSNYNDGRTFPDPIPAKTDLLLRIDEVSATIGCSGAFDILLVEETLLSDAYLNAIGQIRRVE